MSNRISSAVNRQRGFTLSEILVTTAIFAIIMIAALAVYDQSNKVFKSSTEAADMQQSTRVGFDKLVSDVRMAGFDYNRGGTITNGWEAPQPDEQIEYAGNTAVALRANFNYNSQSAAGNGLEAAITPKNTNSQNIFPYVTTNNDEIVIYALRSADSTKNNKGLAFYVDDYTPRAAFPSTITPGPATGSVSHPERQLILDSTTCTGCGIDTTNANPPYTLYRITVSDVKAGIIGTPVAENIRSMNFSYYTDGNGTTLLTNPDGTAIATGRNADGTTFTATGTGAIGGDGQYNPDSVGTTTNFNDRIRRSIIQSVRVDLVGMNATQDLQGYKNPTETIAAYKNYREYALSSLIVPRNLGKTGYPEPVYSPPATPSITAICTGFCGSPVITWTPPAGGGPVESYVIEWDTSPTGAFAVPHQMTIADPTQVTAILPDDGVANVGQLWYYRMKAVNSNGASPYSSVYSATPKNNTRPATPTLFHPTDDTDSTAQANKITLTWTSPSTNVTPLKTLSCTGTGGSTDGSVIPSVEPITYKIYRGTTLNFAAINAVIVLDFTSASQPASAAPGSTITWVDNPTNDPTPPANCMKYYYRIRASNRCRTLAAYNVSGLVSDAQSLISPPFGSNAIPGYANGAGTPTPPAALAVDTVNSGCPLTVGTLCTIKLNWNKVTSDTSGNAIGVDTYRITRSSKHQNNIPASGYSLDTSFGTGGYMTVSGFSSIAGATATWTDATGPVAEPSGPFAGAAMSYEYTVSALGCGVTPGAESNVADYPSSCTISPTIIQCGATGLSCGGTAGGDTPAVPWVMNAGDTITVQQPAGITIANVVYNVTAYPSGTAIDSQTVSVGVGVPKGFSYGWSDRTDGQMYQVNIIVTTTTGCVETHIKYVQDQAAIGCAFVNVATSPAMGLATSGSTTTASITYSVTNIGTDPINFHVLSPVFDGSGKVTWADPTGVAADHPTLDLISLVWGLSSDNFSGTTSPTTRTIPSGFMTAPTGVAAAASFNLTVRYSYKKTEPVLATNPTQKLCISYRIPSEPTTTKFCNLVGQAASTANPGACD